MKGIEEFMGSFGFKEDPLILLIICVLALLFNLTGGLFTNIIRGMGGTIFEKSLISSTSFRLALVAELFLIIYIVYYHTVLVPGLETAQMIFWGFMVLAAPLLALIGAQLTYVAFAGKIEDLKNKPSAWNTNRWKRKRPRPKAKTMKAANVHPWPGSRRGAPTRRGPARPPEHPPSCHQW